MEGISFVLVLDTFEIDIFEVIANGLSLKSRALVSQSGCQALLVSFRLTLLPGLTSVPHVPLLRDQFQPCRLMEMH